MFTEFLQILKLLKCISFSCNNICSDSNIMLCHTININIIYLFIVLFLFIVISLIFLLTLSRVQWKMQV